MLGSPHDISTMYSNICDIIPVYLNVTVLADIFTGKRVLSCQTHHLGLPGYMILFEWESLSFSLVFSGANQPITTGCWLPVGDNVWGHLGPTRIHIFSQHWGYSVEVRQDHLECQIWLELPPWNHWLWLRRFAKLNGKNITCVIFCDIRSPILSTPHGYLRQVWVWVNWC